MLSLLNHRQHSIKLYPNNSSILPSLARAAKFNTGTVVPPHEPITVAEIQAHANDAPELHLEAPTVTAAGSHLQQSRIPFPRVPHYEIVSELGRGGMGEVYLAKDADGDLFALKTIRADRVASNFVERFTREKRALLSLNHPHVIRIYHAGKTEDGAPFFVMQYLANGTLAQHLNEYQSDPRRTVALMAKIADALQYLHEQGQIHRDLKPQNILLDDDGEPYVSDFGLVKDFDEPPTSEAMANSQPDPSADSDLSKAETKPSSSAAERLTLTNGVVGTLSYMSPEQVLNNKALIGPQTDVWALGVMLYELITGVRPFAAETPATISSLIQRGLPCPLSTHRKGLPPKLERIVAKCLAVEPRHRYKTAAELARNLRALFMPRKTRLLAAIAALAVGIGVAIAFLGNKPPRAKEVSIEDRADLLRKTLGKGETVTIVGLDGRPDYFRIRVGDGDAHVRNWPSDGAFTIDTPTLTLMEVIPPEACRDGFRLTAAVRINNGQVADARGGLYYGYNRRDQGPGPRHLFAELAYTEFSPSATKIAKAPNDGLRHGWWAYSLRHFAPAPADSPCDTTIGIWQGPAISRWPMGDEAEPWRILMLELTPTRTTIRWDDAPPKEFINIENEVKLTNCVKNVQRYALAPPPLDVGPAMGAGFFVSEASVSFRSVVVKPLSLPERP